MVELKSFVRSPHLSEIRLSYKRRASKDERLQVKMPWALVTPYQAEEYLRHIWNKNTLELVEDFVVVCLNLRLEVLGWVKVATGGITATAVDSRIIFAVALQTAATQLLLAHNHPAGTASPSLEDREFTERMQRAGELLEIRIVDHIILTRDGAFSFSDAGLL